MMEKIKLVLLSYDKENREIEVEEVQPGKKPIRGVKKGMTVDEFKKLVREKFGDRVEIVNRIKKDRELLGGPDREFTRKVDDDRYNMKDIREAMKNRDMRK